MNSAKATLLALLLVCSLPAITIVAASPGSEAGDSASEPAFHQQSASQPTPVEIENTTNQLPLTGEVRTSHVEAGADLGVSLAASNTQLQIDHEQYVLAEREFNGADDDDQAVMIENAYDALKDRIDELEERERETVRAHANGDISDSELVRVLLQNYNEAVVLDDAFDELDNRDDLVSGETLSSTQTRADEQLLELHQTPIRTNIDAASQTQESSESYEFRIQTSEDGYRLSVLDDNSYTVETIRFDNRDADGADQFEEFEATDRAMELYPWVSERETPDFHDRSYENLYSMEFSHDNGQLDINLDAATGDVYHEEQEVSIDSLPTTETETKSFANFDAVLNKTPANGPVELTAVNRSTGEPVQETIEVDGVEIGETDEDGALRYLPPEEEDRYDLTANGTTRKISPN